jgi:branched-chain amino acid transport system permease protein
MLQAAAEGLAYGGLYCLLGLGFFLTYGVLRRIDLAYGTVIMASVYFGAMVTGAAGLPWFTTLVLTVAISIPMLLLVALLAFVLVRGDARFSMAATLGIWMAIEELILQSPGRGRGQAVGNPLQDSSLWTLILALLAIEPFSRFASPRLGERP